MPACQGRYFFDTEDTSAVVAGFSSLVRKERSPKKESCHDTNLKVSFAAISMTELDDAAFLHNF
jgi:hypothetical protein